MASVYIQLPYKPTRTMEQSVTLAPTNATGKNIWYQDGQFLICDVQLRFTGAAAAGDYLFSIASLPGSPVIDTNYLPGGTGTSNQETSAVSDDCYWFDAGNGWLFICAVFVTTQTIGFVQNVQRVQGDGFANGDSLNFKLKLPIVGWR